MKLGRQNITMWEGISRDGAKDGAGGNKESGLQIHQPYLSLMLKGFNFA